jgi:hypothetical protein
VIKAEETPARKTKSGAGSVPPNCDHIMNPDLRSSGRNQES